MIVLDLDDANFIRILLPNFCRIAPGHLDDALAALDLVNKRCKCAKVYLNVARDNAVAAMEFLDSNGGCASAVLPRYLAMGVHAAKLFAHRVEHARQDASLSENR